MVDLAYHDAALLSLASKAPHALNITFCFSGHFTLKKRVTSSTFNAENEKHDLFYPLPVCFFRTNNRPDVWAHLFWFAR